MSHAAKAEGFSLAVPVDVRFRDMDSMGHVNNAVYFTYFENARIAYWRAVPGIRSRRNLDYILARAECDFRSPTTIEDELVCHVRVASFGGPHSPSSICCATSVRRGSWRRDARCR